jgi:hypothetical protein
MGLNESAPDAACSDSDAAAASGRGRDDADGADDACSWRAVTPAEASRLLLRSRPLATTAPAW